MDQETPISLNYAQTERAPMLVYWLAHVGIWSLAMQVHLVLSAFLGGRVLQIFRDFKVELPALTMNLMQASRWLCEDWLGIVVVLLSPIMAALLGTVMAALTRGSDAESSLKSLRIEFRGVLLLIVFDVVLHLVAFAVPMITLLHSVAGAPK